MYQFGASIFPTDAVTTITSGISGVLTDNIAVILGILAFVFGLRFIMRLFNKSTKGKL